MTDADPTPSVPAGGGRPAPVVGVVCGSLTMGGGVMRVEKLMSLGQLAELMGSETTEREAELMRQFLMDDDYYDTDDVSESEWLEMIRDAVVLAADEAAGDAGPTHADLRGEVDHGD